MRHFARRSTSITLTLVSSVAAGVLTACRGETSRHCVDPNDRVVPDSMCSATHTRVVAGGGWYPYRYYYGGRGFAGIGSVLRGGSYRGGVSSGAHVGGGTARGGFGAIGGGHASAGS